MVQKSMERLSGSNNRTRNRVGAIILSASLLLGSEQAPHTIESPREITKNLISPFVYEALDSQLLAGVVRDPDTNEFVTVKDKMASPRDAAFHESLDSPIAQLGRETRAVSTISVVKSNEENGQFDPGTKAVTLFMNDSPYARDDIFSNSKVIPKALDHEVDHALNTDWYDYLSSGKTPDDPSLATKIAHVASTCIAMNREIFGGFIDENRELVASSFDDAEKLLHTFHSLTDIRTKDYRHTMQQVAEAVRENNPAIYDAPGLQDPTCKGIDISSIAYTISDQSDKSIETSLMYKVSLISIQSQLDTAAEQAFACITEGKALSELLHDMTALRAGHPQDDPTETASSIVTTLLSNPKYFVTCIERMPEPKKQALLAYISAEIDIMSYTHHQLIAILRSNPEVSEIIDKYIVIDKQE